MNLSTFPFLYEKNEKDPQPSVFLTQAELSLFCQSYPSLLRPRSVDNDPHSFLQMHPSHSCNHRPIHSHELPSVHHGHTEFHHRLALLQQGSILLLLELCAVKKVYG